MSKPDDVSRDAPQRASPDNSIKLAHVDDGVTSPETRPKLAAQAGEHLVHVTVGMPTTSEGLPDAEQVQRAEGGHRAAAAICGNTAHSRAADNPSPPAPSSARIGRSLSPGISGTPAPARVRPAADSVKTTPPAGSFT